MHPAASALISLSAAPAPEEASRSRTNTGVAGRGCRFRRSSTQFSKLSLLLTGENIIDLGFNLVLQLPQLHFLIGGQIQLV